MGSPQQKPQAHDGEGLPRAAATTEDGFFIVTCSSEPHAVPRQSSQQKPQAHDGEGTARAATMKRFFIVTCSSGSWHSAAVISLLIGCFQRLVKKTWVWRRKKTSWRVDVKPTQHPKSEISKGGGKQAHQFFLALRMLQQMGDRLADVFWPHAFEPVAAGVDKIEQSPVSRNLRF